jgi:hypothetical protein
MSASEAALLEERKESISSFSLDRHRLTFMRTVVMYESGISAEIRAAGPA